MLRIDIPGFGLLELEHFVTDFTGTLSVDGILIPEVKEKLRKISDYMQIHVLTSDTFGTAKKELDGIKCNIKILDGTEHDIQKESFVEELGREKVVAFGNGRNDCLMLRMAKLGIAVTQGEGCATSAVMSSDIVVTSASDGLGLLTDPKRTKATLRY